MKKISILLVLSMLVCLPSCMVTKTSTKNYEEVSGQEYYYAKGKQCYLFWGLLPVGKTGVTAPEENPCQVRTRFGFADWLASCLTGGIFCMQEVRVVEKRSEPLRVGDKIEYYQGMKTRRGTVESIVDGSKCVVRTEKGKLKKMKLMNVKK